MKALQADSPVRTVKVPERLAVTREIVDSESELLKLRGAWDRLTAAVPSRSPIQDWHYLWTWWEVFGRKCPRTGRPGRLHCVVVRADAEVVGIVPLFYVERPRFSLMPCRLRPFGYAGRIEPFGMTDEPLVALHPRYAEIVAREAADEIDRGLRSSQWDCAVLCLYQGVRSSGNVARTVAKKGSAYVDLPPSWKEFRSRLSKSMRDNLSYYPRLLSRTGLKATVLSSERDLPFQEALAELVDLHKRRTREAKDRRRRDHLPGPEQMQFIQRLQEAGSKGCKISIELLCLNGIAAAAQLLYEDGDTLVLSYSGFDPCFAKFSPLLVLQSEIIQGAITRGIVRLDLMAGSAPWQERWRPTRDHPYQKQTFISKRPLAILRSAVYLSLREVHVLRERRRPKS